MTEQIENTTPVQTQPRLERIRMVYARGEELRYVSHLDTQLVWERTLRRAGVPLAHSQGFNPHPRMHMASALPLGFLSRCEILDFWMIVPEPGDGTAIDVAALTARIQAAAPPGLTILSSESAPLNEPALQVQVQYAEYHAVPLDPIGYEALASAAAALLGAETLPRERRGKTYDLRPLVEQLEAQPGDPPALVMRLMAQASATGRPEEVLDALGFDPTAFRVERLRLILG